MQQTIRVAKGPIHAKIMLPGSKSITLRALLLAALADGVSEITTLHIDDDVKVMLNALSQLGIVIQLDEKARSCIVAGCGGKFPKKDATLWCGDKTSITNYVSVACAASPGVYSIDGSSILRKRSFLPLLNILYRQGVQLDPNGASHLPFTIMGADSFEGGEVIFNTMKNSSLISALFIIAPYGRSNFIFTAPNLAKQTSITLTCDMMAEFGVLVHRVYHGQYIVPVPQRYQAKDYDVEPDLALAAYFFTAAAVTEGEMTIQSTNYLQSKQAAVNIFSLLEKMGCRIIETLDGLTIKSSLGLEGIDVSTAHLSDDYLALMAAAPFAKSPTKISFTTPLRSLDLKRINAIKTEFTKMNIRIESNDHSLFIFPSTPQGCIVDTHGDYHVAMILSIIGLKTSGVILKNTSCITHVYPDFFAIWDKLPEPLNISA